MPNSLSAHFGRRNRETDLLAQMAMGAGATVRRWPELLSTWLVREMRKGEDQMAMTPDHKELCERLRDVNRHSPYHNMLAAQLIEDQAARIAGWEEQHARDSAELRRLCAERDHWKANHANQVARSRVLVERTDMPLERVKACELIGQLQDRVASLEAQLRERGEPVAWYDPSNLDPGQSVRFDKASHEKWPHIYTTPLYAHPPAAAASDYVLSLLIAAGHVTQEKVDEAREIARKTLGAASQKEKP